MVWDLTVTEDGTFAAGQTSLHTNGCEHIAFSVDCLIF